MRPRPSRLLPGLLLGAALVTAACGGGSDDSTRPGWPGSAEAGIADLLANVPADLDLGFVSVTLHDRALELAGVDLEGEPGDPDLEHDRMSVLTGRGDGRVMVAPPTVLGRAALSGGLEDLVVVPSRVAGEIVAGEAPNQIIVTFGDDLDPAVLDTVASWAGGEKDTERAVVDMQRRELADIDIVSWLGDNEVDVAAVGPLGSMPYQAGRVAVPTDGVLVHATNDNRMTAALETIAGDADSLVDDERFAAVAAALDDAGVVAAHLTTAPISGDPNPERPGPAPEGSGLAVYDLLAVGGTATDGRSETVIVLHHPTAESAERNADLLREAITNGTDALTGRLWSEIFDEPEVVVDDLVTIIRASTDSPTLWSQLIHQQNPLLAVG